MNSANGHQGYRAIDWCCGGLSLAPPMLFIGIFGRSDWTRPEVTVFVWLITWAVVVGSVAGISRRSTDRHRLLFALACPLIAAALAVILGFIYEVCRSQFPMTAIVAWSCYYSVVLTILSSPAVAAFLVTHSLTRQCQTSATT